MRSHIHSHIILEAYPTPVAVRIPLWIIQQFSLVVIDCNQRCLALDFGFSRITHRTSPFVNVLFLSASKIYQAHNLAS